MNLKTARSYMFIRQDKTPKHDERTDRQKWFGYYFVHNTS